MGLMGASSRNFRAKSKQVIYEPASKVSSHWKKETSAVNKLEDGRKQGVRKKKSD